MRMTRFNKSLSRIVCFVLIAAMALLTTGCVGSKNNAEISVTHVSQPDGESLGQGQTRFTFSVVDVDGKETVYTINTDKKTVGDALMELGLISGDESEYGLYVKTVNGITVDYNIHKKYWAFYVNGEYALEGVNAVEITEGSKYTFKVE